MGMPSVVFTREQLNILDCWPDITMREVAARLHKSVGTAHRYLAMIGNLRPFPSLVAPTYTGNEPKCSRCGIFLSEAPAGRDGECGWCLQEEDYLVKMWAGERPVPGYFVDIEPMVLVGMRGEIR